MKRSVTIIRPGETDRFGDPVPGSSAHEMSDRSPWVISPPSSADDANGQQNRIVTTTTAYVLGETRAEAGDLIRVGNRTWQIDGHPARAESPFTGRLAGYQVALKAYEG